MLKGSVLGSLISALILVLLIPELLVPFLSGNGREYNTFLFQTVDSFAFCCICKWNFVDSIGRRY